MHLLLLPSEGTPMYAVKTRRGEKVSREHGGDCAGSPEKPRPATAAFLRGHVVDWSRVPYIGGAYTHPSLGARSGDRETLGEPVGRTLFFAGEACHEGVNPCMQAALETGRCAAQQVLAALHTPPQSSKL